MRVPKEILWNIIENADNKAILEHGGVNGIVRNLESDTERGIESRTIKERVDIYGNNVLPDRISKTFIQLLLEALGEKTIIILIVCAVVSLILEIIFASTADSGPAWIDGAAILIAVAIVSLVTAISNRKQEQQFDALNRIKSIFNVAVIRSGEIQKIMNYELVVGDIVSIQQGDSIPADGLLISGDGLRVDQSTANGESEAVPKNEKDPILISNTHVVEGCGKFVVICVGMNSHHGKILSTITNEVEPTPLQAKLEILAEKIGLMGIMVASITFVILCVPWVFTQFKSGLTWASFKEPLDYFIVSVTIVACAVPEGLPLAVTISLAFSMRKMMDDNNFVRRLQSCETMGNATVICTDKTGTLTKNEMNVERIALGYQFQSVDSDSLLSKDVKYISFLKNAIAINTLAVLTSAGGSIGSQTECALIRFSRLFDDDYLRIRENSNIVEHFLFDRERKLMTTVSLENNMYYIYTKGAPDELISRCKYYINDNCQLIAVTPDFVKKYHIAVENECEQAYRTLAIACRESPTLPEHAELAETDLTLLCTVSIRDSLRENTVSSIRACQRAGIRVVMVTGDHIKTAEAIAKECGILTPSTKCVCGSDIRKLSPSDLDIELNTISVVARSSPMDKHLIVNAFKRRNDVVAVTGDGTNDVPAMVAADVGFAMGKSGTELAKEASDIVVLDDDFKSIVRSVVWGRSIYNNIRRFLQFQLTANVTTLVISFMASIILHDTPFKAVQLLWVNLIMDSLGALSLATGRPDDSLLNQMPELKDSSLISPFMVLQIIAQSCIQLFVLCGILLYRTESFGPFSQHHYTILFNVFVLSQMFNLINARVVYPNESAIKGFFDNPLFYGIMFSIGTIQITLVQGLGHIFHCDRLNFLEWIACFAISFVGVPLGVYIRLIDLNRVEFITRFI